MGSMYVNFTVKGPTADAVVKVLAGRSAFVCQDEAGTVVVYDEDCDSQDAKAITKLASELSKKLACPLLAVLNHDDDVLQYQLFINGRLHDSYDSNPGYFEKDDADFDEADDDDDRDEDDDDDDTDEDGDATEPEGGDAKLLCGAFGSKRIADVEQILGKTEDSEPYAAEIDRHLDLVKALGLPEFAVGYGYEYLAGGDLPDGLTADQLVRVK
jgi:hypothetical protein